MMSNVFFLPPRNPKSGLRYPCCMLPVCAWTNSVIFVVPILFIPLWRFTFATQKITAIVMSRWLKVSGRWFLITGILSQHRSVPESGYLPSRHALTILWISSEFNEKSYFWEDPLVWTLVSLHILSGMLMQPGAMKMVWIFWPWKLILATAPSIPPVFTFVWQPPTRKAL